MYNLSTELGKLLLTPMMILTKSVDRNIAAGLHSGRIVATGVVLDSGHICLKLATEE